ncbi:MAG TPA: caspase family protein [Acidobacteriota bacterium]|nr:caspase family protein [Acidobacteriota bacterium]
MSRRWIAVGILFGILSAGTLLAQDRAIKVVSSKNNDGSVSSSVSGETVNLGVYHALLIGINKYQHPEFAPSLSTPLNDLYNMRELLIRYYGFSNENVKLLQDDQATRAGILHALTEFRDVPLGESDNLLVYYAGHGFQHPNTEDGFWIPADATSDESTWVPVSEIRRIVKNIKAKHTLLISDSCFSGTLTRATVALPVNDRFMSEVAKKDSYQVLTSGGLEPVADGGRDGMSLFAYSLSGYLKNPPRPYFTTAQLYTDIAPIVSNASGSRQTPEHGKIPGTFDQNGQFIFMRVDLVGNMPPLPAPPPAVAAAKPVSTLAPASPTSIPAGRMSFLDITFASPTGWDVTKNQPGQTIEYKEPQSGASIALTSFQQESADALLKNPSSSLKVMSTNFVKQMKARGFKKVDLNNSAERAVGELHLFSMELNVEMGPVPLWIRSDVLVDAKASRSYNLTSSVDPGKKGPVVDAFEKLISSIQRNQ